MTTIAKGTEGTAPDREREVRTPLAAKVAAVALVLGSAGNLAQSVVWEVAGGRPDSVEGQMAWALDHTTHFTVVVLLGTFAVPLMAIGFFAAARLLTARARRTGLLAGALLLAAMWGFQAMQVAETIQLAAVLDGADQAPVWDNPEDQALLMVFGAPFLLGAPLGLLVLTIGALVTSAFPRWVAFAWLLFLVLDFGVGSLGPVDPHWLYVIGAIGLARHLLQDRARAWRDS